MKRIFSLIFCFASFGLYGQSPDVETLGSSLNSQWKSLEKDWRYQKGDNPEWAKPEFNDDSWHKITSYNLNMPGLNPIAERHQIAWFRKRLRADSNLNDALVLNITQSGASEIYLDGKLLHKLGVVSAEPNEVVYHNPYQALLSFPLQTKEQVLSIRFLNEQEKYPVYIGHQGNISLHVSTLGNAHSKDAFKNGLIVTVKNVKDRYYIVLGISILLFILFSSFFFFFPSEKVNGYFALSVFFLSLFIVFVLLWLDTPGKAFAIVFSWSIFSIISYLLLLFCSYKIFNYKIGFFFWVIVAASVVAIPMLFLFRGDFISPAIGVLLLLEIIRISIKSISTNKKGAIIFLTFSGITLIYWICYLTNLFPFLAQYAPFAFLITPIGLAFYLGYSFGARSQALQLKLAEVEQLSKEKQFILLSQNETLEQKVKERTSALNQTLENLKSTQSQLIQSEKMASLGELTAGIAHEIQNPLNFVNNFSEVSNELINEMKTEFKKGDTEEGFAIADDIKQNLEKILHHGKRADAIVKGMLQHSSSGSGKKEPTDINKLADEYLRLAYHGLRAKDKSFNATLKTDFDETVGNINVIPQDIGRVILNLITNAFYAVDEKKKATNLKGENYEPTVSINTKKSGDKVLITVSDNGNGIPALLVDKIFQPFFTTKPTGEGTGLGLSLSYDIVKAHGGEIKVTTKENDGTVFTIQLPV